MQSGGTLIVTIDDAMADVLDALVEFSGWRAEILNNKMLPLNYEAKLLVISAKLSRRQ
jgi:hypothetical protein